MLSQAVQPRTLSHEQARKLRAFLKSQMWDEYTDTAELFIIVPTPDGGDEVRSAVAKLDTGCDCPIIKLSTIQRLRHPWFKAQNLSDSYKHFDLGGIGGFAKPVGNASVTFFFDGLVDIPITVFCQIIDDDDPRSTVKQLPEILLNKPFITNIYKCAKQALGKSERIIESSRDAVQSAFYSNTRYSR